MLGTSSSSSSAKPPKDPKTAAVALILNAVFEKSVTKAFAKLGPFIAYKTIQRIMRDKDYKASKYTINTIDLVLANKTYEDVVYRNIAKNINQGLANLLDIMENYTGEYRYFRYKGYHNQERMEYVSGTIKIINTNGVPIFEHYRDKNTEIRHRGYVYVCNGSLYMLGFGQKMMRLSITRTISDMSKGIMHGVIASVAESESFPFGAHFILVSISNEKAISMLADETLVGNESQTLGEKYFRSLIKEKVFYLKTIS